MASSPNARVRRLLFQLQDHIRDTVVAARAAEGRNFARVSRVTAADTIYHVDRITEAALLGWMEANWPRAQPVELVAEGIEEETTFPRGTPVADTRWKLILDPIDGTRGLMYDKRSAWSLAGLAPQRGRRTHLGDIVVAVMTELPTSKQTLADQFGAIAGGGVTAERIDLATGARRRFRPRPSQATDFGHGFASFAKYFPEGKVWIARVEETVFREIGVFGKDGAQPVFDDQYISSGGQLYGLLVGHDRMVADVRPLAFARLGLEHALCCHPYDLCTALILREAGGVVETPEGRPIHAPLDTTSPVAWVGYANPALARRMRPVLRRVLAAAK